MAQTEREVRLARLDELRRIRDGLAGSGDFRTDQPADMRGLLAEAWIEKSEGGDAESADRPQRQSGDRPILRKLIEQRFRTPRSGAPVGGRDDMDPQVRRDRLKRLLALRDRR